MISDNNIIENNINVNNFWAGMFVDRSKRNSISFNTINGTEYYGMIFGSSYKNSIHDNNLIDNNNGGIQAMDHSSNNYWNTSTSGNYWSDWTTPDANSDGIVDKPYSLLSNNNAKDFLPLAEPAKYIGSKPIIDTANVLEAYVNETYYVKYTATDLDTPPLYLTWSFETNATWLEFSENQELSGTPSNSDVGTYWIRISVSDDNSTDSTNFTIFVKSRSGPPVEPPSGNGPIFIVRTGERFIKIQDALNKTVFGDIVRVWAGIYNETLTIRNGTKIIGNGSGQTIIKGGKDGHIVKIVDDDCSVEKIGIMAAKENTYNHGILVESDNNVINGCYINVSSVYTDGIYFKKANSNSVLSSTVEHNSKAIYVRYSDNNSIINTNMINNYHGLFLSESDNNLISFCNIFNNSIGVTISRSDRNEFNNSNIYSNSFYGIFLEVAASKNRIMVNNFKDNHQFAAYLTQSTDNNSLYHNIFIDNGKYNHTTSKQAHDDSKNNHWDFEKRGNYWSDWTMPDKNNDGIVDLPYVLNGTAGAKDNYPLANISTQTDGNYTPQKKSPYVISTSPANNSENIEINGSIIKIIFSNPMNTSSVNAAISIIPNINYTLFWNENNTELIISFNDKLPFNTTFQLTISTAAKDMDNNHLKSPVVIVFTTEKNKESGDGDNNDHVNDSEDDRKESRGGVILLSLISALAIIILLAMFSIIYKNRRRIKDEDARDLKEDEERIELGPEAIAEDHTINGIDRRVEDILTSIKDNVMVPKKPSDFGPSRDEILEKLQKKYMRGELSEETYNNIKESLLMNSKREESD